jgi:hypothetical protein
MGNNNDKRLQRKDPKKMSLDSGTYILTLKSANETPEYYVRACFAVENLFQNDKTLLNFLADLTPYHNYEEAMKKAIALELEQRTEFGVWVINQYKHLTYADLERNAAHVRSVLYEQGSELPILRVG